ncbi:MAG: hypothetical protein ACRYG8_02980 [Janthinobacterium lividum]
MTRRRLPVTREQAAAIEAMRPTRASWRAINRNHWPVTRQEGVGNVIAILRGSRFRPVHAVLEWLQAAGMYAFGRDTLTLPSSSALPVTHGREP